jgi:hypothetical protein
MNPVLITEGKDNGKGLDFYRELREDYFGNFASGTTQGFYEEYYLAVDGTKLYTNEQAKNKHFTVSDSSDFKIALTDALAYLAKLPTEPADYSVEIAKIK